ncbi:MAG: histidine phosphatase family protein [Candidatus Woesearchaeota archaeon]|nr:histidine phosphatase family protein [Candidatus Woesearchaeota archaeon]
MKLIIIRHGETEDNVKGLLQGHKHGKLTKTGIEQARKLAFRLKDEEIDAIYSSDLQRAKDTTEEIAKFHKVPIHYTSELREQHLGIFEGKPKDELRKTRGKRGLLVTEFKPKGGESLAELKERAQRFLNMLFKMHTKETILISSHAAFIMMLLGIILNKSIEEAFKLGQSNACVNIIEIKENSKHKVHAINCIKHL